MPIYNFLNEETGEREDHILSISDLNNFKIENPNLKQLILGAPSTISGTDFGKKMDDGWKENLSRIAEAHPNSAIADKVGGRSSTKSKVSEVAKKHGRLKNGSYKMEEL